MTNTSNDIFDTFEDFSDSLSEYLDDNFISVFSLKKIRTSNNYVFEINNSYIGRIRTTSSRPVVESNAEHNSEVTVISNIRSAFNKDNWNNEYYHHFSRNNTPIPKFVHNGIFQSRKISIYEKAPGVIMSDKYFSKDMVDNFCDERIALDISKALSIVHSCDAVKASKVCEDQLIHKTSVDILYLRQSKVFFENRTKELLRYNNKSTAVYNKLIEYMFFNYHVPLVENKRFVICHGSMESGHIIIDRGHLSSFIDWEHMGISRNGWWDLALIYSNFVIGFFFGHEYGKQELTDFKIKKATLFWDGIIKSYICPVKGRLLKTEEIKYIEFLGFIRRYRQICGDLVFKSTSKKSKNQMTLDSILELYFNE
jgi:hypothetical protein